MKRTETPSANRDPSYAPVDISTTSRESDDARGTRPAHLAMRQPPASACNTGPEPLLTPGHCSPRSGASGHRFAGPSPRVAPEKRDQLGHRSHAPATFFEVRFASLFEARCRLFVSANHTTYGHDPIELSYPCETRAATHFSSHGGPPFRESSPVRAGDAPSCLPPRPRFPHRPRTPT